MTDIPTPPPAAAPHDPELPQTTTDDYEGPPTVYDPAEYRWVPVRRNPRLDGWTEEKQRRFIETLADTGQVGLAAKAVGMTRAGAYALRRTARGAAFARAWDAARHHAGALLEDVAFERAIEGREELIYNMYGTAVGKKRVFNDRLLMFLLRHLKPERYMAETRSDPAPEPVTVDACLREMEPKLPAPPEEMLDEETFQHELTIAFAADGMVPSFLREERHPKSDAQLEAEARKEQAARAEAAYQKSEGGEKLSLEEFGEYCCHLEPSLRKEWPDGVSKAGFEPL